MERVEPPLCASVQGSDTGEVLAAMRRAAPAAGLLELRLDLAAPGALDLARLVAERPRPLLVTCRPRREGGAWAGEEGARLELLRAAARAGAEWLDVERDAVEALGPLPERTRLVVSQHRLAPGVAPGPALQALEHPRADVLKLALAVETAEEALELLELARAHPRPVAAVALGTAGWVSRVAGPRWGAPWVYAAAEAGRPTGPGQLEAALLASLWAGRPPRPETALYGVIGRPIGHSRSPLLMNAALARLGQDAVYAWLEAGDSVALLGALERDPGWRGASVTRPFKEVLAAELRRRGCPLGPEAEATGALNTLVREAEGWSGHNTDARAARRLLRGLAAPGERVAILGSGGSARALAWACREEGLEARVHARNEAAGRELARELGVDWGGDLEQLPRADSPQAPRVLVNCTPASLQLPPDRQGPASAVYELVYAPEETALLARARALGAPRVTGLEHLALQAWEQLALWFGAEAAGALTPTWLEERARG